MGRLSDGRQIFWFDSDATAGKTDRTTALDTRDMPPVATTSEVRLDPLLDEWVAMASHRQGRTHLPPADECPLCPSRDGQATEIPTEDYDVVVFENRFPSLAEDVAPHPVIVDPGDELLPRRPGAGRCEVVCFTSDHDSSFSQLTTAQARLVVDAWADRTSELNELPFVGEVYPFENRGQEIGVTLQHPHGQIYAYPFVTPRTQRMIDTARKHRDKTGGELFADVLAAEQAGASRIVEQSEHWTAYVPSAARWPVEVHLVPHRHVPDIPALTDAERDDFAALYLSVLRRFDRLYDSPLPYIAAWQQAPARVDRDLIRLHLQLFSIRRAPGKLKYLAGSESGMGVFINDILPEDMAERLRAATPR